MGAGAIAYRILLALIVVTTAAPGLASTYAPWQRHVISRVTPAAVTMRSLPAARDGAVVEAQREDRARHALAAATGRRSRASRGGDANPSSAPDRPRRARSQLRASTHAADDSDPY